MAFRSATSSSASGFAEPSVTVNKPSGAADGDLLITFFAIEGSASSVTTLAGWTAFASNPIAITADGQKLFAYYKIASGEGASWVWTWSNGGSTGANYHCLAFTGRNSTSPISAQLVGQSNSLTASPKSISVTTITAAQGDDLVFLGGLDNNAAATMSYTAPGTFTEATDVSDSSFCSSSTAYKANVIAGATGTITMTGTYSAGNAGCGGFLIALAAATGGAWARNIANPGRHPGARKFKPIKRGYPASVASGDMVGSTSLTFTVTGTLTGTGALTGASTLTFTPTSTLTGTAPITGATSLTFSPAGTLAGIGALAGSSTLTFAPTASLTGTGALSGSSTLTFAPTASLTGTGALTGTASITFSPTGTLADSSSGNLAGSSSITFTVVGTLTGTGALSGSTTLTFSPAGVLADANAPVTTSVIPAGSSQRNRRHYIEIDGQTFPVDNAAQASELLQHARALAERQSEASAEKATRVLRKKALVPKVVLPVPVITVSPGLESTVAPLLADIKRLYEKAAIDAELQLLIAKQMAEEDDDDDVLLLI